MLGNVLFCGEVRLLREVRSIQEAVGLCHYQSKTGEVVLFRLAKLKRMEHVEDLCFCWSEFNNL